MKQVFEICGGRKMFVFFLCFFTLLILFVQFEAESVKLFAEMLWPYVGLLVAGNVVSKFSKKDGE